jgi:glycosyltransferase involved in cell wall biosynthesis
MNASFGVTALIPAYNASKTLVRALKSVQAQTHPANEILLINDGSLDDTAAIAHAFGGVRVIDHPQNRGLSAALNTGIAAARYPWIALLDADDEWLPTKLEVQLQALAAMPEAIFSATGSQWVDDQAVLVLERGTKALAYPPEQFWRTQFEHSIVAQPTVMAKATTFQQAGGFDEQLRTGMDQKMWMTLALQGKVAFVTQALTRVHLNASSLTKVHRADTYFVELALYQHFAQDIRARLPKSAAEQTLAKRFAILGRDLCAAGHWRIGAPMLLNALRYGVNPKQNLWYLMTTLPWLQPLKRAIRGLPLGHKAL